MPAWAARKGNFYGTLLTPFLARKSELANMDELTVDRIFAGCFSDLPEVLRPLVRIYTSSTFTDMPLEKNVLITEVYPKLKEYCRERYGLEFQVS